MKLSFHSKLLFHSKLTAFGLEVITSFDDSSLMLTSFGSVGAKSIARAVTSERSGNSFNFFNSSKFLTLNYKLSTINFSSPLWGS